ncbi:ABATE domain-containing protein [Streptomyces aurantiacus]|uniref:Zinc finger CGNR domain-containing protein n=1 Tax=Streptomyces aurantiacus JA 4570 TaxID=1286094 RepID=S3ZMH7_9ACTN|nr:ABATE domain-containing protein [Streptomyces aurantiacus]EPH39555.1 hypothetical protein STRAU_7359 [Streptomyces aurantiacus JA 4570]
MAQAHTGSEARPGGPETAEEVSPADLRFRLEGGRPSLTFTATLGKRTRAPVERLREPSDLARWFRAVEMTAAHMPVSQAELTEARLLREALYRLFTGVRTAAAPPPPDVDAVNRWAARPLPGTGLVLGAGGTLRQAPPALDTPDLLGLLARDAADLLGGPLSRRIRECAADDCSLLFADESRAGARRWCSMDACGARAKMAEYRARRRNGTTA